MINYRLTNHVELLEPELVDGVEIQTRKEREAEEWFKKNFAARVQAYMDREMELAFYGGDPPKLSKP